MEREKIKVTIPGSFSKFKDIIDKTIDEFEKMDVVVLAPDKGWIYKPQLVVPKKPIGFRPLPSEVNMTPKQVEDSFLRAIVKADFIYLVDPGGYIGDTVAFELGAAMGAGKLIYAMEAIKLDMDLEIDLLWRQRLATIRIMDPESALIDYKKELALAKELAREYYSLHDRS